MATNTRLSQRSSQERLVATPAGKDPVVTDLLRAEACAGAWRIVEAFSASGGPFELLVAWSGGDGVGQEARLTVPRATRLAVYASSMTVRVANLVPVENRVGCSVADGYCVSANQYEVRGVVPSSASPPIPVAIPPFARELINPARPTAIPASVPLVGSSDSIAVTAESEFLMFLSMMSPMAAGPASRPGHAHPRALRARV